MNEFDQAASQVAGPEADPIARAAAEVVGAQRTTLRSTLYNSLLANPEMAARAQKLGRQTGVPADVVERNLPEVQRNAQLDEFDKVLKDSPAVAQWLMEQNNAKVAHDDVENMGALEAALRYMVSAPKAPRGGLAADVGLAGRAGESGLLRASAGVVGLAQAPFDFAAPALDPLTGAILPENPVRKAAQGLASYRQGIEAQSRAVMPKGEGDIEQGLFSGFSSLATNVAGMPLLFAGPAGQRAYMTQMTAPVAGQAYGEARDKGVDPLQAATFGASQAAIEYATEKIPMSRLLGDVKAGTPFFKTLMRQATAEVPGEQIATVLQDMNEWAVLNPDKPFSDYAAERPSAAAQTLVATLVGTGGQVAVVKGVEAAVQRVAQRTETAQTAEQSAQGLEQLDQLAAASKVRQRDADTFETFIAQVSEDGPVQNVYLDANTLMQSGMAEQLAAVSPSVAEQLPAALATGGEIQIPVAEYTARIAGTEFSQGLIDDIRVEGEQFTRRQAQEYMQNEAQELQAEVDRAVGEQQLDDEFKASQERVKQRVLDELNTVGRFTADKNELDATLIAARSAVRAAQLGMTPEQFFEKQLLRVQAESVTGGEVLSQDGREYPMAPEGSWYGEGTYKTNGGRLVYVTPDEYIAAVRPLSMDDESRENIDILKKHIEDGGQLDPLLIRADGKEDGRHRAYAAKELGIARVPVIAYGDQFKGASLVSDQQLNQSPTNQPLPATINIDGKDRPTTNSKGQAIAATEQGVRNFWKWFGDSRVVDAEGRPLVVYHGTNAKITEFKNSKKGARDPGFFGKGFYFTPSEDDALSYADSAADADGEGDPKAIPVYLSLQSPFVWDMEAGDGAKATLAALRAMGIERTFVRGDAAALGNADERKKFTKAMGAGGHDGVFVRDEDGFREIVAFNPTQIKSAIGNSGEFDPGNANILMQSGRDLVVTHNLTAANLLHAVKMGGIPVPSLAVTKKENPLTGFGEITLIGDKNLADPKGYAGTKVFGADIYSPRYPTVTYEFTGNMRKRGEAQAQAGLDATGSRIEWDEVERNGPRELERTAGVIWQFLRTRGVEPDVVRVEPEQLDQRLTPFVDSKLDRFDLMKDDGFITTAWEIRRDTLIAKNEGNVANAEGELAEEKARVAERGRFYFASELAGKIEEFRRAQREAGKVDKQATLYALQKQVRDEGLTDSLEAYAKDLFDGLTPNERIFQGFTNSGNRKYIPHTLDNVVKILKKELRGGESFNYGVGSLRAKFTPQFKSVAQIQKAKDRLISKADMEKVKKEIDNQFWEVARTIDSNISGDTAVSIMEDAAKMGVQRAAKSYGYDLEADDAVRVAEFLTRLRELPTEYFEAKILREVDLAEFAGAVVPEGVDPKVVEALRARGVNDIRTYKKGDETDRAAKIGEFENLFFQNKAGPRGSFSPSNNTITLLKNADLSTFLHEAGHYFFEGDIALAAEIIGSQREGATVTQGEQQILDDVSALLRWHGIQGSINEQLNTWYSLEFEEKRAYHERTAESFEAYLFEGKAPSIELQPMFQKFRAWLLNVYRSLKDFLARNPEAGKLNDEVRAVFDRMLATTEQIQLAEQARSMLPLFETPDQAGMTVDEFAAYQALGIDATNDAIQDVQARTLRDLAWTRSARSREIKKLQKKSDALRKEVEAEVRREVMSQPVYRAWQFLTGKEGEQVVPGVTDPNTVDTSQARGKLRTSDVKELGAPEDVVARIMSLRMTSPEGSHPDIVADMFGFSSGDELVRALAAATPPKDEIEGLTDARMLERYGDLATPEAIERAADSAIHNEARARFVATEANALAKAIGKPKILAAAARDFARATVARLKVRAIRPNQYATAEVRAAKAAQKASQSGDLATAAAEKRNQLVQNYLTRAAYDAQDEVEKGLQYLRKFDSEGTRKGLDADYVDQIDALLERFDLRKGVTLKAIDKRTALAAWAESQREQGLEPEIPADLLNEALRKSYKDMTVEELRGLIDTVKQIEHLGRLKNRLLTAADNRAFDAVKTEIVTSIEANSKGRTADTRTPTTNLGRLAQSLKNFGAAHIKAATWARVLDGGKDGGPMWEYLVRSANERGNQETTMRAEATEALTQILAPVFKLGRMGGSGQFFPTINRSLNREARIALALNTGNQGNLQRLLGGEGWTVQQIQPVLQSLSAAEWQAVQAVWDHFESYRPQIGAKERRVYGREPEWVEPTPFQVTTSDGEQITLKGGYYPIKYDPAASQRAEEFADAEGAKRQLQGAFTSATTRRSFTKSRVEEVSGRPLLYTLSGLYSGVNDVIHDLAWHEWLIDANRILRSKSIDAAIRNTYGPAVKQQFKSWVQDIAEGDRGAQNAAEVALSRLRQGVSAAGLGFNAMSAAMQITGFNQSIVRVGAKWIGKGIAQYIASPIESARSVVEMSPFMADRSRTQFRELNELRNRVQDESATMRNIKLGTYFMMMRMQRMVDVPTWLGAYEKAIAEGHADTRAAALADQAVIDSQGSGMVKDLSAVERGGPALKLFTVFYSYMNTALNMGVAQTMTAKSKGKLAADLVMLYTVPVVLGSVLKAALTPGGDDEWDPEKLARKLAAEQLSYLMGLMVVVREFGEVSKIVTGAEGAGRDYSGPAGLRAISDAYRFTQQAAQGEFDDSFRKASINLLGDFTGLPAAQINRTITGVNALAEGETDNPAAVVFGFQQ